MTPDPAFAEGSSLIWPFICRLEPALAMPQSLVQLRLADAEQPRLMGMLISGMTFQGEQWRLATVGPWTVSGERVPDERFAPSFSRCAATWLDRCRNPSQPDRP